MKASVNMACRAGAMSCFAPWCRGEARSGRRGPVVIDLFDVLDSGRRVHVQLPTAFAQQKFNGAKIPLIDLDVLFELGPIVVSASTLSLGGLRCLPRKNMKKLAACHGLFAAFSDALPIQGKHLFLET
jgi:hypothetical protein